MGEGVGRGGEEEREGGISYSTHVGRAGKTEVILFFTVCVFTPCLLTLHVIFNIYM